MGIFSRFAKAKRPKESIGAVAVGYPGGTGLIKEPYMGAWQQNKSLVTRDGMLASSAVFACVDLISSDVAKLGINFVRYTDGVWQQSSAPRYTDVIRKPNSYQVRAQFVKNWVASKLTHGNAYILLTRNNIGAIIRMEVLNPRWVVPLVAPDGSVFYQVTMSPLAVEPLEQIVVSARDVIHDRGITAWHPLVGMTPIAACAASATLASSITTNSAAFFSNAARPSGFLTAPGAISQDTANRLKETLETGYTGQEMGKTLVGGDGLAYTAMTMSGTDAQTIEQLQWTAQDVARCFHVPGHKIGLDTGARTAQTSAIYESMYYSDCLQAYLDTIELLLDDAFAVPDGAGLRFDTQGLMRMDEAARHAANAQAVGAGYMKPNEARATVGLAPVVGGDTPYLQQQNYSLAALAKRDANDPFSQQSQQSGATDGSDSESDNESEEDEEALENE